MSASRIHAWLQVSLAALLLHAQPLRADPVADFYRGRTLTLVSGFTPNGENDTHLRILGRHIGRFIPGQPQVVPSSMPGAGTLVAANHLFKIATPDGTAIGMFTSQAAVEPFLGNKAAVFDPITFGWIGSMSQDQQFCAVASGAGVPGSFEELLQTETVFGTGGPSSDLYRYTAVIKNVLGAKMRIVSGYAGMPAVHLALQRGEVNGVCGITAAALRTSLAPALAGGNLKLLLQMGGSPTAEFGQVPSVFAYARTESARELLDFFFRALAIGRPITAPPAVPAERLAALRTAFAATLKDPLFLAEAKTVNMSIDPVFAGDLDAHMLRLSKNPPEFFQKVRAAYE